MRTFKEIYSFLDIEEFLDSEKGTLYCGPKQGVPQIIIRHFDGEFSAELVQPFVELTKAVREWIDNRQTVAKFVTLEALTEVGVDFIVRPFHVYRTSLSIYDDKVDRSEIPEEIEQMREALKQVIGKPDNQKECIIEKVVTQSLLEPANKTYFNWSSHKFCIVELEMTCDDLQNWTE